MKMENENMISTGSSYNRHISIYRYLILIGGLVGTLFGISKGAYPMFVLSALLFVVNSQVRTTIENPNFLIISVILDVGLFLYIHTAFSGYTYILLILTLVDIMQRMKTEGFLFVFIVSAAYIYSVVSVYPLAAAIPLIMLYLIIFLLLLHLRKELSIKTNVEELYEELRRSNYELEAARGRLIDYSKQIEKITKLEERNRISRELHDTIGHNLAGILMQVDAAKQIMELDREKGMGLLEEVYKNINNSIEVVRQTVRDIRPVEYQSHKSSIQELINRFMLDTGIKVEYKISGVPHEFYPSMEMVIYRNIQEALTNSLRHGGATSILIHIIYKLGMTEVVIADNGTGCSKIKKGLGLSGMEERLEIIGGKIEYETENGFRIHMYIPGGEM